MKQYGKKRTSAFPMYWCNQKAPCCESSACGYECRITRHKCYARKDAKGKPMIAFRMQRVNPISAKELADRMMLVAKSMGVVFETVYNSVMRVTGAMRATLPPLFSGDYFNQ